jgi:DNA-binding winged helix-turn-helix (wHTH) protein/tetratricopeptide (TPR) repeat protein
MLDFRMSLRAWREKGSAARLQGRSIGDLLLIVGDYQPFPAVAPVDLADEPDFELGSMTIKPAERAVVMGGDRRELQPRVMQVLVALAKARPGVVSRDRFAELCWNGRIVGDDALNRVVLALRRLADEFTPPPFTIETVPRVGHRLLEATSVLLVVFAIATAAGLLLWQQRSARVPTVLITAATTDSASQSLAQDLAMKLGSLETADTTSLRLIGKAEGSSGQPDLIMEVRRVDNPAALGASLLLRAAPDRAILWSKEFEQPSRNLADLKQQVAFTAAPVLGCAAEAFGANGAQLNQQTLKLYLNGCAALAHLLGDESESVIPMFREVLRDAPRFEGAWAKLLFADSDVFEDDDSIETRERLKADLAAARKINPDLAAVYQAEILLLPANAHTERMRLANRAVDLNPQNAAAYVRRSQILQSVGRMKDAVVDARRAMGVDPLSLEASNGYVFALGAAGLHDAARQELREAERLWPGANSVASSRFAFNLRYGDPRQASAFLRANPSEDWMNARSYLEARADRTPENVERAIQDTQRLYKRWPLAIHQLIQVYGEFDRERDLLELLLNAPDADVSAVDLTFRAPTVEFWRDPRALLVAKRAGLLHYWRNSGEWPDFCSAPDLPYDCKTEAAKIAS